MDSVVNLNIFKAFLNAHTERYFFKVNYFRNPAVVHKYKYKYKYLLTISMARMFSSVSYKVPSLVI